MGLGRVFAWKDIAIITPWGLSFSAQEISWDDEKDIESIYGTGGKPLAWAEGNWKAEGKMTLLIEEYQRLLMSTRGNTNSGIFDMPLFPIVVTFMYEIGGPIHVVNLLDCKFVKRSRKASQGDKKLTVELDFLILGDVMEDGISAVGESLF